MNAAFCCTSASFIRCFDCLHIFCEFKKLL
nr:MAG TPA: hypothetical protein [Caudoviricetes sp.]